MTQALREVELESTSKDLDLPAMVRFLADVESSRILVVGDALLDEYVEGTVDRVSPEAPVPVLRVLTEHHLAGGAAHVARIAASLGADVELVAVVGDDDDGRCLREACEHAGIGTAGIVVADDRPTTRKTRIVSGPQQIVRLDRESTAPLAEDQRTAVCQSLNGATPADAIVVSDYAKGVVDDDVLATVMELSQRWGAPVLVDPKHDDISRYRGAHLVKLNRDELAAAVGARAGDDLDTVARHASLIRKETGASTVVVTLGAGGMATFTDDSAPVLIPASGQEVFDVTGAGDVVAAVLGLGLASDLPLTAATSWANLAAGVSIRRLGTQDLHPAQLLEELVPRPAIGLAARSQVEHRELVALAAAWRRSGERIVFTNGCFDLFHRGHLELLRQAAEFGDRLVVALDADDSVRRLKGPTRPVIPDSDRADIVGALPFVDAVVVFDHGLRELIAELRPDVLVKGADYVGRRVVGREEVEASGGRVELVALLDRRSTTDIVERLATPAPEPGAEA